MGSWDIKVVPRTARAKLAVNKNKGNLEDLWMQFLSNFTFVSKLIMIEYFTMEVDQGFAKIN